MIRYPYYMSGSGKPRLVIVKQYPFLVSLSGTNFGVTHVSWPGGQDLSNIRAPMRVWSLTEAWPDGELTWAKITDVDDQWNIITVEGWSAGTPPNGGGVVIDGYVIDLPYCERLTETFTPDHLTHSIWGGDSGSTLRAKFRGWKYEAELDYSTYIGADSLTELRPILNADLNDQIIFIPRRDEPGFNYNVIVSEKVELSRFGRYPGYKGFVLSVKGQENVHEWPMIYGYGMAYSTQYGTCL